MKPVIFLFMILIFPLTASAETYLFVGSNFPVLSEETTDGKIHGISVNIAESIAKKLGHRIIFQLYPWKRAQYMVKNGDADVLMAPYKTPEREKWLDYSEEYFFEDRSFFYVRPDSEIVWNGDFSSLQGQKIGMVLGWSVGTAFEKARDSLLIDYAPNIDSCFKKLIFKRIDMLPTQEREANAVFARLGLSDKDKPVIIYPEIDVNYDYFGFSKQKNLLKFKKEFDRELRQMKENGELSELLKKYNILN